MSIRIITVLTLLGVLLLGCAVREQGTANGAASLQGPAFVLFYTDN